MGLCASLVRRFIITVYPCLKILSRTEYCMGVSAYLNFLIPLFKILTFPFIFWTFLAFSYLIKKGLFGETKYIIVSLVATKRSSCM